MCCRLGDVNSNGSQVDVLPSKNQALCMLIKCIVIAINDVTGKSCEQRLITKEHIATHAVL